MARESFHTYINLDVVNNSSTVPKRLVFNTTRTIPFLSNAEDYFLTVARFNLQTSNSLPVFIPEIQTGQTDPNLTAYAITFYASYNGNSSTQRGSVFYSPTDLTQSAPSSPIQSVDKSTTYYWVYNVTDWIIMLNLALTSTMLDINQALGTSIYPV